MLVKRLVWRREGVLGKGFFGLLGEHGNEDVVTYFRFGDVCCCDIDEDIPGIETDFGVV